MILLWIAIAGALGAACRYVVDFFLVERTRGAMPWGIFVVNLTGSLGVGVLAGLLIRGSASDGVGLVVGTGFLGAYTTFSTWMFDTVRLLEERAWGPALFNALGSLLLGIAATAAGLWVVV